MKSRFDWVKDDPCYGCKHAKRLKDDQINGMFGRRFGCTSPGRINGLKNCAARAIENDCIDTAIAALTDVRTMHDDFARKGYFDCSGSLAPACYEKEEKKQ